MCSDFQGILIKHSYQFIWTAEQGAALVYSSNYFWFSFLSTACCSWVQRHQSCFTLAGAVSRPPTPKHKGPSYGDTTSVREPLILRETFLLYPPD